MKRLLIILTVTLLCLSACFYCSFRVNKEADVLEKNLNQIYASAVKNSDNLKKEIEDAEKYWNAHKSIFSFVTDHSVIREFDSIIASLRKYEGISGNDQLAFECARGLSVLEEIRSNTKFSFSSVV